MHIISSVVRASMFLLNFFTFACLWNRMTRRNASSYNEEETADSCLILNFRNGGLIEWTRNNALKPHSRWYFQILLKEGCENFLQSLSVVIITVVYVVFLFSVLELLCFANLTISLNFQLAWGERNHTCNKVSLPLSTLVMLEYWTYMCSSLAAELQ